jgi:type III restriction enzyme
VDNPFFEGPILNSPYEHPRQHWELDDQGQPTRQVIHKRRPADFITPIPKPKKHKAKAQQQDLTSLPRSSVGVCAGRSCAPWRRR